jgi:hypothetical protein
VTLEQIIWTFSIWGLLTGLCYILTGWKEIVDCFSLWFSKEYWKPYNIVEAASWFAKVIIIIPGLVFGIQIWWLYFFAAITSLALIWASSKKLLPSLVAFNTIWTWLAIAVIVQHLVD